MLTQASTSKSAPPGSALLTRLSDGHTLQGLGRTCGCPGSPRTAHGDPRGPQGPLAHPMPLSTCCPATAPSAPQSTALSFSRDVPSALAT